VTGLNPPVSYSLDTIWGGLNIDSVTGIISGIPDTAGIWTPLVTATDTFGCVATYNDTVIFSCPSITVVFMPDTGKVGESYNDTIGPVTGGTSPYTFSVDTLPPGLALDSLTGIISGIPLFGSDGIWEPIITATDTFGCQGFWSDTLVIDSTLFIHTDSIPTIGPDSAVICIGWDDAPPGSFGWLVWGDIPGPMDSATAREPTQTVTTI